MPKNSYVVGLDIGTKKVAAIIGEITEEKKVEIIGIGTAESRGLRKGIVVNLDSTVDAATSGMRYACTGWTGTGDVDPAGSTNITSFTMTQDSSITWTWKTQYQLLTSVTPVGGGSGERLVLARHKPG